METKQQKLLELMKDLLPDFSETEARENVEKLTPEELDDLLEKFEIVEKYKTLQKEIAEEIVSKVS